jgi:hypothetical protein
MSIRTVWCGVFGAMEPLPSNPAPTEVLTTSELDVEKDKRWRRTALPAIAMGEFMRRKLPIRLIVCAALAGSASLAAAAVPGGVASAVPLTVSCAGLTGTSGTWSFSGCSGTAIGLTGASGTSVPINPTKLKITWATSQTSKVLYASNTTGPSTACPIVTGLTNVGVLHEVGKVVGGSAVGMIEGLFKLKACEYSNSTGVVSLWMGLGNQKV